MYGMELQRINLNNTDDRNEVQSFLQNFDLKLDDDVDYTIVLRDESGSIKGTCSKAESVFKCFAVSEELRGEGITSTLISNLIDRLFEEGKYHSFVFTKPDKVKVFSSLNFKLIYKVENAALLEYGMYDINKSLNDMAEKYNIDSSIEKGALVMNCNPFTLGHRYLIEQASKSCSEVLVFVVQEDRSLFPFDIRYKIIKEGILDLKNVKVIPGGEYVISSATFPTYFLRDEGIRHKAYAELDAGIFAKYFCSKFNIVKRFVGEEPYCISTRAYNEVLGKVLPEYGVKLCEIERKKLHDEFISASKVRELIRNDRIKEVKAYLPDATVNFLDTEQGMKIIEKIKESNSVH